MPTSIGMLSYDELVTTSITKATLSMPPFEAYPICNQIIGDWHVEWFKGEGPSLYKGLVAMDCPLCGNPVGYHQGKIGPAPNGVILVRRDVGKAAVWAASQAILAGGTLQGYITNSAVGMQYAQYWNPLLVLQADAIVQAKQGGP